MKYLNISFDRFKAAYNSYLFIPRTFAMGDKVVLEYISWSNAAILLNQFFPELVVEFEKDISGSYIYTVQNSLVKEAREEFTRIWTEKQEQLNKTTDWKLKKELKTEMTEYIYDNRGSYVLAYLVDKETGNRTPSLLFPVMDNMNNPIINPHVRDINDAKARAGVKAISLYTGLGLRLFTREDIDINGKKGLVKDSPKWKRILSILESLMYLEREVDFSIVNLGRTEKQLEQLAYELYPESLPMREAEEAKKFKR